MTANTKELFKKLQPLIALAVMVLALTLLSDKFLTGASIPASGGMAARSIRRESPTDTSRSIRVAAR